MDEVTLPADSVTGKTEAEKLANIALASEFKAAVTAQAYAPLIGETDLAAVLKRLGEMSTSSVGESSKEHEYLLSAQVIALDSIFNRLAIQAHASIGKHPKVVDTYLRLALKAQSQCRATAETLANLKSPRQHISQTNVATALQVNIERDVHHVDTSTAGSNAASDPNVEALGKVNGATNIQGESYLQQECTETRGILS